MLLALRAHALPTGTLTQAGPGGCISDTGSGGDCADGKALNGSDSVAVSADGTNVYVASRASDAVAVFNRNVSTGALTQLEGPAGLAGCVSETGSGGICADGKALNAPESVAVSPDGGNVYVASGESDAVAVFKRNTTTGALAQLEGPAGTAGCVSEAGSAGKCADGKALDGAVSVAVGADGKSVYVASRVSDAVAVFKRNVSTGALTQLEGSAGCVSETGSGGACADGKALDGAASVAASADGKSIYLAAGLSDAVAVFRRGTTTGALTQLDGPSGTAGCVSEDGSGGTCAQGRALDDPASVASSPDGKSVYVASGLSDAVAVFRRNATTGALTQPASRAGCVSQTGAGGSCADGKALDGAASVAVSADRKSVYVASRASDAVAVFRRGTATGALVQLSGTPGCVSESGSGGACTDGRGLNGARSVAVSEDGESVHVASFAGDAVTVFARSTNVGELTPLTGAKGCVSASGSGGCTAGRGLDGADSAAVSADGKNAYVTSFVSDAVAVFARNTESGALLQLSGNAGCVSETGSGGACGDGKALDGARALAVSGDGRSVYVVSSGAVAVFRRDTATGALTQLAGAAGCVNETGSGGACVDGKALVSPSAVAVSGDGRNVYVVSSLSDAVAVFARDTTTGALTQLVGTAGCVTETGTGGECVDGKALDGARSVAVSGDGKSVYVASGTSNAVAVFRRNASTGQLTRPAGTAGCISETGSLGACADGVALSSPTAVTVSADGKSVYVASFGSDAVAVFARDAITGQLTQPAGTAGCVRQRGPGSCADGRALDGARSVAVSGDGKSVYVASDFPSDAVAVFKRDATTGLLSQLTGTAGCVSETGLGGECVDGKALDGPFSLAISADGNNLYVPSIDGDAVAVLARET